MSDKSPDKAEEAQLFEQKAHYMGYRFCPRCAEPLEEAKLDGRVRLKCSRNGCDFIYYQNPVPAAGAVIVKDDKILMVKRGHPPRVGDWTLPAGFMEWDEHPRDTAVRELKEETGLDIELTGFFEVYSGSDDYRNNAVLILYHARVVGGRLEPGDDADEVRFFSFDELPQNIAFQAHHQALADYQERHRNQS